jgi:hypothetical protein
MTRTALHDRRLNETVDVIFGAETFAICVGFDGDHRRRGQPKEVFATGPKIGSEMQAIVSDACVLISIALQHGIAPAALAHSLGRVPRWVNGKEGDGPASVIGLIVEALTP